MVWLIAIGCLALGLIIGALTASRLSGTPTRIKELENQVKGLEERHDQYKDDVSDHFNVTADLVQHLTQSYRDVYQHLATGAQDLCTAEVANKLLPAGADAVFETSSPRNDALGFTPPKDYATKQSPDQKGALSEDFGIEKASPPDTDSEPTPPPEQEQQAADEEPATEPEAESEVPASKISESAPDAEESEQESAGQNESEEVSADGQEADLEATEEENEVVTEQDEDERKQSTGSVAQPETAANSDEAESQEDENDMDEDNADAEDPAEDSEEDKPRYQLGSNR